MLAEYNNQNIEEEHTHTARTKIDIKRKAQPLCLCLKVQYKQSKILLPAFPASLSVLRKAWWLKVVRIEGDAETIIQQ